jgi:hypothetical protein
MTLTQTIPTKYFSAKYRSFGGPGSETYIRHGRTRVWSSGREIDPQVRYLPSADRLELSGDRRGTWLLATVKTHDSGSNDDVS